jgi:hypothetical protein
VLAFAAERAVQRILRIDAADLAHFRAALRDATSSSVGHFAQLSIYALE